MAAKLISTVTTDFSLHYPDIKPFPIPLDVNLYRLEFKGYFTVYYLFNYLSLLGWDYFNFILCFNFLDSKFINS
jgi:hypothetical protein